MRIKTTFLSALLLAGLLQAPVQAAPPPASSLPAGDPPPGVPADLGSWRSHLAHDWDRLRGRADPLQRALGQVRQELRIAHDERFVANRGGRYEEYLQRAHERMHQIVQDLGGHWNDPMVMQRLGFVAHTLQGMASGAVPQTPRLYQRLDWELGRLQSWRWAR